MALAILDEIKALAAANRIWMTDHARDEAAAAGASYADVRHALTNATSRTDGDRPGRHKVVGPDLDGDDLTCVVVIENGLIVITVW